MTALRWEVVVGKEMGEEGSGEEVGGGGALAFSSGIFLSVVLSFLFLPPALSLHGWRHGYQGSPGTDNMAQTMAPSPRRGGGVGGWGGQKGGRQGHRGRGGRTAH